MTDKELADRVVGLGVANRFPDEKEWWIYSLKNIEPNGQIAKRFVRDWRVAGALMERCEAQCVDWDELEPGHWRNMNHTSSTPRAIIEACVEALEQNDDR